MSPFGRAVGGLARFGAHVTVFAVLGPLIGVIVFFGVFFFGSLFVTGLTELATGGWGLMATFVVAMGYALGVLPAALVGGALGLVSAIRGGMARAWETLLASMAVPAVVLWLVLEPLKSESGVDDGLFVLLVALSPIAAFVCRAITGALIGLVDRAPR